MSGEHSPILMAEQRAHQGITIEFSFSTNPAYEQAVAVARKQPSYQEVGDGAGARHRVHYSWQELAALQEMKHAAWELREKRAFVNGVELRWEHMAQMTNCFYEKVTRGKPGHCFFDGNFVSPFGCRYTLTNLTDRISSEWLSYGKFDSDGAFRFDKERIRAVAKERLRSSGIHFCPASDEEFLNRMVNVFPDRVHPSEDTRWRFMHTTKQENIGVVPVDINAAWSIVHELQARVREQRAAERTEETGKRTVPDAYALAGARSPAKKGLLARLFGR